MIEISNLIKKGIKENLISIDENTNYITYIHQNKKRNFNNPEEKVQAETFLKLIFEYNYPVEHILQFVSVQTGSETREADIIVFSDETHKTPYIIVECKKQNISDLEFKVAVDQAFSYATTELAKYVWVTSGIKDEYYEVPLVRPRERIVITDIPHYKETTIPKYRYVKGGKQGDKKFHDLEIVSEDNLTSRFKQAHNALWAGGELNPSEAFDELDKLIFCKIWDEKHCKKGEPYKFQIIPETIIKNGKEEVSRSLTNQKLLERIKELYEEGRKKDPEVFKDDIRLNAEKLSTVVGYLQGINLSKTDLDSKGRAFETFMGSFFRGDFGQYFTPRPIVKFIVEVLPITKDSLVLDTSCGSGGFLLHALDKVRKQATKEYYEYETDPEEYLQWYKYWHDFAEKNLYGIEINEQIARVAKMNMIIHDDGHTNVISCDGLLNIEPKEIKETDTKEEIEEKNQYNKNTIQIKSGNPNFKSNHFDFIITNPPFGSIVKQTEKAYLHQYNFGMKEVNWLDLKSKEKKRESQSTEVLFIEQAYRFLKEGGYLAIVIPDGILTNSTLQYVRDAIEEMYRIVAIVSMPQTAFSATGAGVKSSVMFLKKHTNKQTETIKQYKKFIQEEIKKEFDYENKVKNWEKEKKTKIKELNKKYKDKKNKEYLKQKEQINKKYNSLIDDLKDKMIEKYKEERQKKLSEIDYDIFMAIAEDIGYDATGKPTGNNELKYIQEELSKFIQEIEDSQK
jgi:type I restriction enzyme M protein